jgi:hypothetical protein
VGQQIGGNPLVHRETPYAGAALVTWEVQAGRRAEVRDLPAEVVASG